MFSPGTLPIRFTEIHRQKGHEHVDWKMKETVPDKKKAMKVTCTKTTVAENFRITYIRRARYSFRILSLHLDISMAYEQCTNILRGTDMAVFSLSTVSLQDATKILFWIQFRNVNCVSLESEMNGFSDL